MAMPETVASMPEMQTRLTVAAVTVSGMPAISAAMRVMFMLSTGSRQQPKRTSSIRAGSTPARSRAAFMATLAILVTCRSRRVPPKAPMAVRHAAAMTTSFMGGSFPVQVKSRWSFCPYAPFAGILWKSSAACQQPPQLAATLRAAACRPGRRAQPGSLQVKGQKWWKQYPAGSP